jgi:hypothetical protein
MRSDRRKKPTKGSLIAIIIALAFFSPELLATLITIGLFILPYYVIFRVIKKGKQGSGSKPVRQKEQPFDDCPKPICLHKDKGEHHVKRGKEVDPWDRPDIDISKYQRR